MRYNYYYYYYYLGGQIKIFIHTLIYERQKNSMGNLNGRIITLIGKISP